MCSSRAVVTYDSWNKINYFNCETLPNRDSNFRITFNRAHWHLLLIPFTCLFYIMHINVCTSGSRRSIVWIFKDLTAVQNTAKVHGARVRMYKDVGRRMTTGFGPWKFFISQWPEVPEQLFRLLLLAFCSFLSLSFASSSPWSLCFSSSRSSVIPCALVTFHENVYSPYVRNSDVLGLFRFSHLPPLSLM